MQQPRFLVCIVIVAAMLPAATTWSQRIRFPSDPNANNTAFQGGGTWTAPPYNPPPANGNIAPVLPQTNANVNGGARVQSPSFDAFSTQPDAASSAPALMGSPAASPYGAPAPTYAQPGGATYAQPYPGYPASPPSMFPGGIPMQPAPFGAAAPAQYLRLFEDLRVTHAWLEGGPGRELDINDSYAAFTMNLPNFLWSGYPIGISPTFGLHQWGGPMTGAMAGGMTVVSPFVELPNDAYSMFGTVDWKPLLTQRLGADVSFNIGVFSDLRTFTTNSLRFFGRGLLTFQVTPTVQVKGGVEHFDRLSLKTLPAGGILWTPNPDVKFDIYFPQPKLSQRLTTLGNTDIWWYVGGEYGGGSWTVERTIRNPADMGMPGPTFSEQVDINDLRVLVGLEWFSGVAAIKGFVEAGYVFDREIVFRRARFPTSAMMPADNTQTLKDTFMIRGGLSY